MPSDSTGTVRSVRIHKVRGTFPTNSTRTPCVVSSGGAARPYFEVEVRPEARDRRVIGDAVGVVHEKADPEARSLASLLIAKGLNVVFVSRQLGHTKPATTLSIYVRPPLRAD